MSNIYFDYFYFSEYNEDYDRWNFTLSCKLEDRFEVAFAKGFYFNETPFDEDAFDEDSQDGYDLFQELKIEDLFPEKLLLIKSLYVDTSFRKKGIATEILKHFKKAWKGYEIYLMPAPLEDKLYTREYLRGFYEKRGFESILRYMRLKNGKKNIN